MEFNFSNKKYYLILISIAVLLLLIAYKLLGIWFTDDAFISFRYSLNLYRGAGLVFNNGEHTQGYTNFLWIIFLTAFKYLHIDFTSSAIILNFISYFCLALILYAFFRKRNYDNQKIHFLLLSILIISSPNILAWTIGGGLEGILFLTILTAALYLLFYSQAILLNSFLFFVLSLVRPEGFYFFITSLMYLIITKKIDKKRIVQFSIIYVVLLTTYIFWNLSYYESILPNTFHSKVYFSYRGLFEGVHYIYRFFMSAPFLLMFFILTLLNYNTLDQDMKFLLIVVLGYIFYIFMIGGDFMFAYRYFLPVMSILYFISIESILRICNYQNHIYKKIGVSQIIIVIMILYNILSLSYVISYKKEIRDYKMIESGKLLAEYLNSNYPSNYSIASSGIGALGFYSNMRIIDVLGLTDKHVANEGIIGIDKIYSHSKSNVKYIINQKSSIIVFGDCFGKKLPVRFAEKEIYINNDFLNNYTYKEIVVNNIDTLRYYLRNELNNVK